MKSDSSAPADFFDEDTSQPVVRSIREVPPLIGKRGNPSVFRAYYFGDEPTGGHTGKLAYLEKYSEEGKKEMERLLDGKNTGPPNIPPMAHLVRRPQAGASWVDYNSPEGCLIREGK